ncbi:hypothetical protein WNZ15_20430 [Roseibium sp. AS2]|uniref:hypothetical protein n=1 Tax=Roseibium sp. AS2 TaxID=3135781 RepID=UPI00317D7CA1
MNGISVFRKTFLPLILTISDGLVPNSARIHTIALASAFKSSNSPWSQYLVLDMVRGESRPFAIPGSSKPEIREDRFQFQLVLQIDILQHLGEKADALVRCRQVQIVFQNMIFSPVPVSVGIRPGHLLKRFVPDQLDEILNGALSWIPPFPHLVVRLLFLDQRRFVDSFILGHQRGQSER